MEGLDIGINNKRVILFNYQHINVNENYYTQKESTVFYSNIEVY